MAREHSGAHLEKEIIGCTVQRHRCQSSSGAATDVIMPVIRNALCVKVLGNVTNTPQRKGGGWVEV